MRADAEFDIESGFAHLAAQMTLSDAAKVAVGGFAWLRACGVS
jgi:hypothetical protein